MRVRLASWWVLFVVVSMTSLVAAIPPVRAEDLGYGDGLAEALIAAENEEPAAGEPAAAKVQTIAGSPDGQDTAASGERLPVASQRSVPDRQAE